MASDTHGSVNMESVSARSFAMVFRISGSVLEMKEERSIEGIADGDSIFLTES